MVEARASAAGERGSMAEYLRSTVERLEAPDIHDRYLWRMRERVAELLERGSVANRAALQPIGLLHCHSATAGAK